MDDLLDELEIDDSTVITYHKVIKGKSHINVKKYPLSVQDTNLKETWTVIIHDNIITSIIRNSLEYKLCDRRVNYFCYQNNDLYISLKIERTTFEDYCGVSGYLFNYEGDSVVNHFWYRFCP